MPSVPLVTELGAKADQFQTLVNTSKIPVAIAKSLQPCIAVEDLFTTADSRIFVRSRPIIPFDQQTPTDLSIVQKIHGFRDAVLMAPKVSVSGNCSIDASRVSLDGIFVGSEDDTESIYQDACSPLLALSVGGASTCVLCYGQTGSGKTYTTSGLLKLFSSDIAPYLNSHVISLAVVEVHSLATVDLLAGTPVQVVEDPSGDIQLLGATEYPIESPQHLLRLIGDASASRSTKATGRNEQSSRSHMIVRLRVVPKGATWAKPGFLFVADLAGSENTADSATHDKTRQMEAKFINSSLMTLKDCIRARALSGSSDKHLHIPFRQSPLTLILRDCFELAVRRPTKTVVIACVSPLLRDARHTMGTLRYASLLAVAPPPVVMALSPDDPNGWTREQALAFLAKASRGRMTNPELVLTEGDGRALVHIPEADFLMRVISTHPAIGEKSAKVIYTELWKAVVDARTKTRQALKAPSVRRPMQHEPTARSPTSPAPRDNPRPMQHEPTARSPTSMGIATSSRAQAVITPAAVIPKSLAIPSSRSSGVMPGKENFASGNIHVVAPVAARGKRVAVAGDTWRAERESGWVVE